jgi:hypothetical protein
MRFYKVTLTGAGGRASWFEVDGLERAHRIARAFLLVTNGSIPAFCSLEALAPGAVTSFGEGGRGSVSVERIS